MLLFFFFTLVTGPRRSLSLKLSDTRVYEPYIRARLGTTGGRWRGAGAAVCAHDGRVCVCVFVYVRERVCVCFHVCVCE